MDPEFSLPTLMYGMKVSFLVALLCWQSLALADRKDSVDVDTMEYEGVSSPILSMGHPLPLLIRHQEILSEMLVVRQKICYHRGREEECAAAKIFESMR